MNRFKKIYVFIFLIVIFSGSILIYRAEPGYRIYDNRMSITKASPFNKDFFKTFNSDNFEKMLKDYYLRDEMVLSSVFLDKHLYRRPFVNGVRMEDPNIFDYSDNPAYYLGQEGLDAIGRTARKMLEIKERLAEEGADFLVVPMPKISSRYTYPSYVLDPDVQDKMYSDLLYKTLDELGVDYIKARDLMEYEDFYQTDHHISKSGGDKIIAGIDSFLQSRSKGLLPAEIGVREHEFKGSRSRRVAFLTGTDKIHEPIYKANFKRSGDGLDKINNFEETTNYPAYMCGDKAYTCIENMVDEGPDIIIYGDSFTNIVESFIWPRVKRMRSYDFRTDLRPAGAKRPERFFDTDLVVLIADENSFRREAGYIFYLDEDTSN